VASSNHCCLEIREINIWNKGLEEEKENVKAADKCIYALIRAKSAETSRFILFDCENISFDASLVIYINSTNIPPVMIINRIYETQNLLSLWLVSFLVGLRTYQHPCNKQNFFELFN
jgi:hypothetical protein